MPKVKITNTFIKRTPIPKDKTKILFTNTLTQGLCLEVRNSGTKTFYYRYIKNNTYTYEKLGRYPAMDINSARDSIQELKAKNSIHISPQPNNTHKAKLCDDKSITLGAFYTQYYLPFIQTANKSSRSYISYFNNHILPLWKDTPMNHITRTAITQLHIKLKQDNNLAASTCNKLIKYLSYTYNLAISWSIPFVDHNPTQHIKLFPEDNIVERYLSKEEIATILKIASKNSNPLTYRGQTPFRELEIQTRTLSTYQRLKNI